MNEIAPYNQKKLILPEDGINYKKIYETLYQNIKLILIIASIFAFLALLNSYRSVPVYQTTALLQLKSQQSGRSSVFSRLGYGSNETSEIDTLEALIRTRYMLEPVIISSALNVIISPQYFPFFGEYIATQYQGDDVAKPFLWLKKYAWGGERIQIDEFTIPTNYENQPFKLVAGIENNYQLFLPNGKLILNGKVGEKYNIDKYPGMSIQLSVLKARPGMEFTITHKTPLAMVGKLARRLQISNVQGNDNSQGTGIFQIDLTDTDPNRAVKTLNILVDYIIYNNILEHKQETQKSLDFLDKRLPQVRNNLAKAEDVLNQYHIKNNTLSMNITQAHIIKRYDTLEQLLTKLKSDKQELLEIYTPIHPLVIATIKKEAEVQKQFNEVKEQIRKFPLTNQEEINFLRETKIKNSVYISLLNSREQLEFAHAAASSSNIRILSDAVPAVCISVSKVWITCIGFFVGMLLATMFVLIRSAFSKTVEGSEQLEEELNVIVRAVLPYSRKQKELEKISKRTLRALGSEARPVILAKQEPEDITVESLRSLRINLHFMKPHAGSHIITLMGTVSDIGKSFVSLNLAQLIADSGKKTLLIDADVRRGRLHQALHQNKVNGLSEFLEGKYDYENLVRPIHDNLFFIPAGVYVDHPLKLFQSQRFQELIKLISQDFEQIIFDTPPILPVSDSILIAKQSHIKLFVVSSGKDTLRDVRYALNKAKAHGIEVDGIILNHRRPLTPYGTGDHYRYKYERIA